MTTATLKLEAIADHLADHAKQVRKGRAELSRIPKRFRIQALACPIRQPWVAEITGFRPDGSPERQFLDGQKDFSEANSVGSRGVYRYYHLHEGRIYQVHELLSWTRSRRYFCTVSDGQIVEMSEAEVQAALTERAEIAVRRTHV